MSDPVIDHALLSCDSISVDLLNKFVGISSLVEDITNGISFIAGSFPCFLKGYAKKFNDIDIFYVFKKSEVEQCGRDYARERCVERWLFRKNLTDSDCGNRHTFFNSLEHYGLLNEDYNCYRNEAIGRFESYREDFCKGGCLNYVK